MPRLALLAETLELPKRRELELSEFEMLELVDPLEPLEPPQLLIPLKLVEPARAAASNALRTIDTLIM